MIGKINLYLNEKMGPRRLSRRRFFFFSTIFGFTSIATWFMADLLWRGGLNGLGIALLGVFGVFFVFCAAGGGGVFLRRAGRVLRDQSRRGQFAYHEHAAGEQVARRGCAAG